jgi:hypothetical protein
MPPNLTAVSHDPPPATAPAFASVDLLCRALSEGLSDRLPPSALAALECTSAELRSTIRDKGLWNQLTITNDWGASELALLREACRLKGVRAIYVDPAWTG